MKIQDLTLQFYHGSSRYLEPGTILTPRNQDYEQDWQHTDFYSVLEKYRPTNEPAHKNSVFMVAEPEDIDLAGGGTEWIFTVEPLGPISKHDLNWSSELIRCGTVDNKVIASMEIEYRVGGLRGDLDRYDRVNYHALKGRGFLLDRSG